MTDTWDLLNQRAELVAPELIGWQLVRHIKGQRIIGRIVETEAYDQIDAASHSFKGQTPRNSVMFGPSGMAYVYFTYGMHYCMNVVCGPNGYGSAVLIRALEPAHGLQLMRHHRPHITSTINLCNGPAKLCQALLITKQLNGHDLKSLPLQLLPQKVTPDIIQTTRIGISRDTARRWRFYEKDNPFVSQL